MIVVDASVLVAGVLDHGPEGRWALEILSRGSLAGPELVLVEATNIVRRLELAGEISAEASLLGFRQIMTLPIELAPFSPFAVRVWELRHNATSYDAWYVAIAEALACPLATLDHKLARAPDVRCECLYPR